MEEARVQRLAASTDRGSDFGRDRDGSSESWAEVGQPRDGRSPRPLGRSSLRGSEPLDQRLERWVNRGLDLVDGVSGARPGGRARDIGGGSGSRGGDPGAAAPPWQGRPEAGSGGFNPGRLGRWVEQRLDWLLDEDGEDDWREPWQEQPSRSAAAGPSAWGAAPRPAAAGDGPGRWREEPRSERLAGPAGPPADSPPREASWEGNRSAGSPVGPRRGLEAISRRGTRGATAGPNARPAAPSNVAAAASGAAGRVAAESLPAAGRPPAAAPISPRGRTPSARLAGPGDTPSDQDAWPDEDSFSVPRWRRPPAERAADPLARPATSPAGAPEEGGGRPLPRSSRRR
jgi:hypothetical protein